MTTSVEQTGTSAVTRPLENSPEMREQSRDARTVERIDEASTNYDLKILKVRRP